MSNKIKSRKYNIYNALSLALKKSGIRQYGATATVFLEIFLEDHGKLYADKVIARKLCKKGEFKIWRDGLVKAGWLEFNYTLALKDKDFTRHKAGQKLIKYINREIQSKSQIATYEDFANVQDQVDTLVAIKADSADLNELKERMLKIEETVAELKHALEPPVIDEKVKYAQKATTRLAILTGN